MINHAINPKFYHVISPLPFEPINLISNYEILI